MIPTGAEAKRFPDILAMEEEEYKVFYALAIYTGCRRGELCTLKWSVFTVQDYEGVLTVRRSRGIVAGQGVAEGTTKNGKVRTIYMCDDMMSLVRGYCYIKKREAEEGGFPFGEYLFVNECGELIHPDTFTMRLRKLYDENGFPKNFHLHTLRRYFASTMLHSGVDKQTVAELAGHGDTSFLEKNYCRPQIALKQNAAARFANVLFGRSMGEMQSPDSA